MDSDKAVATFFELRVSQAVSEPAPTRWSVGRVGTELARRHGTRRRWVHDRHSYFYLEPGWPLFDRRESEPARRIRHTAGLWDLSPPGDNSDMPRSVPGLVNARERHTRAPGAPAARW